MASEGAGAMDAAAIDAAGPSDIIGAMDIAGGGHEAAGIVDIVDSMDGLWADTPAAAASVNNAAATSVMGTRELITCTPCYPGAGPGVLGARSTARPLIILALLRPVRAT